MSNQLVEALKAKDPERFKIPFKVGESFNGYTVKEITERDFNLENQEYTVVSDKDGFVFKNVSHNLLVLIKSGLLTLELGE